jgi:hypothetical protein
MPMIVLEVSRKGFAARREHESSWILVHLKIFPKIRALYASF